jgi:hypothetical protein
VTSDRPESPPWFWGGASIHTYVFFVTFLLRKCLSFRWIFTDKLTAGDHSAQYDICSSSVSYILLSSPDVERLQKPILVEWEGQRDLLRKKCFGLNERLRSESSQWNCVTNALIWKKTKKHKNRKGKLHACMYVIGSF